VSSEDRIPRVQRLSRVDTDLLGKDPQYLTGGITRFLPRADGSVPTPDEIIDYAGYQLTRTDAPQALRNARQRIRRVPGSVGRPYWEDDPDFDVRNHFSVFPISSPIPVDQVGRLLNDELCRPLDPERPLWRLQIIPSFDDGSFGLVGAYHHAAADGISGIAGFVLMTFGLTPEIPRVDPGAARWVPRAPRSAARAVREAAADRLAAVPAGLQRVGRVLRAADADRVTGAIARVAAYLEDVPPAPETRRDRRDSWANRRGSRLHVYRFPLLDLRLASRALGATINELLLSAIATAWPTVEPAAPVLWARMPVNSRGSGDMSITNLVDHSLVRVPCGLDPLATLRAGQADSGRVKHEDQGRALGDLGRVRWALPRAWQRSELGRYDNPDIILSNMAGYPFPLYCQGGALCDALVTSRLADGWGKFTFCTFADTVYGTLVEDSGPEGAGPAFDRAFREAVSELGRRAEVRGLLTRQRQLVALSPRDLDQLTLGATTTTVEKGETIVSVGDPADAFYVVKDGTAVATVDGERTATYRPGESFGEVGVFRSGVRRATVTAERRTELVRLDRATLLGVFRDDLVTLAPVQAMIDAYDAR